MQKPRGLSKDMLGFFLRMITRMLFSSIDLPYSLFITLSLFRPLSLFPALLQIWPAAPSLGSFRIGSNMFIKFTIFLDICPTVQVGGRGRNILGKRSISGSLLTLLSLSLSHPFATRKYETSSGLLDGQIIFMFNCCCSTAICSEDGSPLKQIDFSTHGENKLRSARDWRDWFGLWSANSQRQRSLSTTLHPLVGSSPFGQQIAISFYRNEGNPLNCFTRLCDIYFMFCCDMA